MEGLDLMLQLRTVNKALRAEGINLELVAGEGYFYFIGEGAEHAKQTSVMVYRLNDLSLEQWLVEARALQAEIAAVEPYDPSVYKLKLG